MSHLGAVLIHEEGADLRHSVRAVIRDEAGKVLLVRIVLPDITVWAAPGGGIEPGETPYQALRRELREEIGLELTEDPPHVWHQRVPGVINDYYLVRTNNFVPRGTMSDAELAAENVGGFRWWEPKEIAASEELFSPRELGTLLDKPIPGDPPKRLAH